MQEFIRGFVVGFGLRPVAGLHGGNEAVGEFCLKEFIAVFPGLRGVLSL
jgi:hypothetical protein